MNKLQHSIPALLMLAVSGFSFAEMTASDTEQDAPAVNTLLAEMNSNSARTVQLLEKIAADGCSRQLQADTIQLVSNMNRNIQIMTDIMVRMGYNIEHISRMPKAVNSFPFMP